MRSCLLSLELSVSVSPYFPESLIDDTLKWVAPAIIAAVFAAIFIIWYCFVFKRVKLASMLLKLAMDISKHHMSVFAVAFGSLIIQAVLSVWYTFTVVATYVAVHRIKISVELILVWPRFAKYTPGSSRQFAFCIELCGPICWLPPCFIHVVCKAEKTCSIGAVIGLIIFETFSFIWTSGVIGNITIATLAGGPYGGLSLEIPLNVILCTYSYSVWYYKGPRHQDESVSIAK